MTVRYSSQLTRTVKSVNTHLIMPRYKIFASLKSMDVSSQTGSGAIT